VKILLVDDDAAVLSMMAKLLQHRGHEVLTCATPFGVSATVVRDLPEVVVVDVMMPGLGGPALVMLISKLELQRRPKLILWSAIDDDALRVAGREAGGVATLSKGLRASEIAIAIERLAARTP
jgi:two-component system OmpR family response regulator